MNLIKNKYREPKQCEFVQGFEYQELNNGKWFNRISDGTAISLDKVLFDCIKSSFRTLIKEYESNKKSS